LDAGGDWFLVVLEFPVTASLELLEFFPPPGWRTQVDLGIVTLVADELDDESVILVDVDAEDPAVSDHGASGAVVGVRGQNDELLPYEGMTVVSTAALPSTLQSCPGLRGVGVRRILSPLGVL
jgi:hypothetical protein